MIERLGECEVQRRSDIYGLITQKMGGFFADDVIDIIFAFPLRNEMSLNSRADVLLRRGYWPRHDMVEAANGQACRIPGYYEAAQCQLQPGCI